MFIPQQIPAQLPTSTTQSVQRPFALGCSTDLGLAEQSWPLRTSCLGPPLAPTSMTVDSTP
jgi:hypothetical protein